MKKKDIFCAVLDIIYPPRCPLCDRVKGKGNHHICDKCVGSVKFIREKTCIKCGSAVKSMYNVFCPSCLNGRHRFEAGLSPFLYSGSIKQSLIRFKYHSRAEYAGFYAAAIYKYASERIRLWNADVLVPVPVHHSRLKDRGYNQAHVLASELEKLTEIPVDASLVMRVKKTKAQKNLNVSQRRANLLDAFEYTGAFSAPERVIIVDDIFTTGSTADAVSTVLKKNGTKYVYVLSAAIS